MHMNQTQQNAIKIWTGIPYTWTNKFHRREDNTWTDIIKPFYKPNTTERERDWVATILSPRDTQIDEKKHDAIGFCLSMAAVEILRGSIKYDTEDIFKLKRHSEEHNCQVMLYEEIQDTINRAKSLILTW